MFFLGKIIKVRGIKGELVYSPSMQNYNPKSGESVTLKSRKYKKIYKVEYFKDTSNARIVKFQGIDTINDALKLVGYSLEIADLDDTLIENENMEKFMVMDLEGQIWGQINKFQNFSHNQIMEIQNGEDIYYVPFVEEIVKKIDKIEKTIIIDPPLGLKNLNKK